MIVKKLTRLGNSSALILDRALMQLMNIDPETPLKVTVEGRRMTVEPLSDAEREQRFEQAMNKTGAKNRELFKRLSK